LISTTCPLIEIFPLPTQLLLLELVGLPTQGPWSLFMPLEQLILVAWLFLKTSVGNARPTEETPLAVAVLLGTLSSLRSLIIARKEERAQDGLLSLEHFLVLVFLYHTLSVQHRSSIFSACLPLLAECAALSEYSSVTLLALSRLLLFTERNSFARSFIWLFIILLRYLVAF